MIAYSPEQHLALHLSLRFPGQLCFWPEPKEVTLDDLVALTLDLYSPMLFRTIMEVPPILKLFQEVEEAEKQQEMLDTAWPVSHKVWFRKRSGGWDVAYFNDRLPEV